MRPLLLTCLVALAQVGCASDPGLRIVVRGTGGLEGGEGGDVDEVRVDVVASQGVDPEEPYACVAARRSFPGSDLPVSVVVRPGELPWRSVAARVEALLDGETVLRTEALFVTGLDEVTEETVDLDASCLSLACAHPRPLCTEGPAGFECVRSELSGLFDDPFVDLACDSNP